MLLRDNIYSVIRQGILSLEFQPGQELREQHLAERYRVSRSPVRDALLRLGQEGFVTVHPRQGYRINPISVSDLDAMYELCLLLEPACAAGAARADDATVATLDRFRDFNCNSNSFLDYLDYNREFHDAVADMCGNPRIRLIEQNLVEEFDRVARYSLQFGEASKETLQVHGHAAIIDAIQAHAAEEAARLAHEHAAARLVPMIAAFRDNAQGLTDAVAASSMGERPVGLRQPLPASGDRS